VAARAGSGRALSAGPEPEEAGEAESGAPTVSVVVPTAGRAAYLDVALTSIAPQASAAGGEVVVVIDGEDPAGAAVARRHGARIIGLGEASGPNAARNAGIAATRSNLLVFVDDDVAAPGGWLDAILAGVASHPGEDVFGGPIRPALERPKQLSACPGDPAPVTALDLGTSDAMADFVWSANLAVRRRAFDAIGVFDPTRPIYGDEEDWLRRWRANGGTIRYLARAGLDHRRAGRDARLPRLVRAGYRRGRAARRYDEQKGRPPSAPSELRTVAGCAWHVARRRCGAGLVMTAHSVGRLTAALAPHRPAASTAGPFLSGESGTVLGPRRTSVARATDAGLDLLAVARMEPARLARAARETAPRRVVVLGAVREDRHGTMEAALAELRSSRHLVRIAVGPAGGRGKWENLNTLLGEAGGAGDADWLLLLDDDVELPRGFLDRFLFVAERFAFDLAQPAHRRRSHAAWRVTRRRPLSVARETRFVEIGPLTALSATTFSELLPFPELRAGWGLDAHWGALARSRGWRLGIVDATPVRHAVRPVGAAYPHRDAIEESRAFLATRPHLTPAEAQETIATHRRW